VLSGREELARYKALQVPAKHTVYTTNLLARNAVDIEFPRLSEVARRVLCISASSTQSEQDFSSVGRIPQLMPEHDYLPVGPTVEAMEIVRWGCRASIINLDSG